MDVANAYAVVGGVIFGILLLLLLWLTQRSAVPSQLRSLRGKHVLITGGSTGIGFHIARRCAKEGAYLTLIARTPSKLEEARSLLTSSLSLPLDSVSLKAVDVSDSEALTSAIKESFEWRPIDVLVCSAGIAVPGIFDETKLINLQQATNTNLLGCVYAIHAAIPLMKTRSRQQPSSIVIVGSLSGMIGLYGSSMYTVTKFALKGLAELLRFELLPWNIYVTHVCPGFTDTPMHIEVMKMTHLVRLVEKLYFMNMNVVQSPDEVAKLAIEGMKRGQYLVTTTFNGFFLRVLSRGFVPAESITAFVAELLLTVPMRIFSLLWVIHAKWFLRKQDVHSPKQNGFCANMTS